MTWRLVQSVIPNSAWSALLSCALCILSGCEAAKQPSAELLLFEAPTGPDGGTIVLPSTSPALAEFAGTTLQIPPSAFQRPVTLQFYRVASWDAPGARSVGAALKIVAQGSESQVAQDVLHISMPLPDGVDASGDRNLMAVEWPSGERYFTGGLTRHDEGKPARLEIETPKLGAFFPVIYPLGPAMPEPLVTPLDVLFVVDNSSSMSSFQSLLFQHDGTGMKQKRSLPWLLFNTGFVNKCKPAGAVNQVQNIHMAVASSDLGVMPTLALMPGSNWPSPLPSAFSMGKCGPRIDGAMKQHGNGDSGDLQTKLCTDRVIKDAQSCPGTCSGSVPTSEVGLPFVRKWTEINPMTMVIDNYPKYPAARRAETAVHCRSVLGETGCGIEMPLGSAAQAIARQTSMPSGFLRDPATSLLVVVVVTNEDDCSIVPERRKDAYPSSARYLSNPSGLREDCGMLSAPECFNMEYRCFALDNQCNESVSTAGAKTGCKIKPANPSPYLASVEGLVKQMTTYQDSMGMTNYRKIGFVTINPSSTGFETEYLTDGMMMTPMLTPYLNLKPKKLTFPGKTFLLGPQLRYEKLYQLKNSMVATEQFSDPKLSMAVQFVIQKDIEQLIDTMSGETNELALSTLANDFQKSIAPFITLTKAGRDGGFSEPCP